MGYEDIFAELDEKYSNEADKENPEEEKAKELEETIETLILLK